MNAFNPAAGIAAESMQLLVAQAQAPGVQLVIYMLDRRGDQHQ
tara:strand:- start:131 stop:259 length:129 start_codon:yes stop_codon:yes gene_type:complete